jgi:cell shape-determining protein MreC
MNDLTHLKDLIKAYLANLGLEVDKVEILTSYSLGFFQTNHEIIYSGKISIEDGEGMNTSNFNAYMRSFTDNIINSGPVRNYVKDIVEENNKLKEQLHYVLSHLDQYSELKEEYDKIKEGLDETSVE